MDTLFYTTIVPSNQLLIICITPRNSFDRVNKKRLEDNVQTKVKVWSLSGFYVWSVFYMPTMIIFFQALFHPLPRTMIVYFRAPITYTWTQEQSCNLADETSETEAPCHSGLILAQWSLNVPRKRCVFHRNSLYTILWF